MPYIKVAPDIVIKHMGVSVYETYINNDFMKPNFFIYNTSSDESSSGTRFDLRDLPGIQHYNLDIPEERIEAIFTSIEFGIITQNGTGLFTIH
jgi:hypothetical protein